MKNTLDYISIKGFRSIREVEKLELRPINIFVGANGSGKSNFLETFVLLNAIRRGKLKFYTERNGGAERILHFGSKITSEVVLEVSFGNQSGGYHIELTPNNIDTFIVQEEFSWCWDKSTQLEPQKKLLSSMAGEAGISQSQESLIFSEVSSLNYLRYRFREIENHIAQTEDVDDNKFLRPNGFNIAAYLLFLKEKHLKYYSLIRSTIQKIAPFFDDFQLAPLRRNENKIRLEWLHKSSDNYFDGSSLSDGTLRFICLATLLLQPPEERPALILLDEPELGLHPYAISLLASMIKAAATQTQVIISTQSPLLIDHFETEDILVTELEDGATTFKRLKSADLEEWLEDYSLGQLWEKNYFGGRPKHG